VIGTTDAMQLPMSLPNAPSRPSRNGFFLLILTLVIAGLEVWGIGASLGSLLK
jgi:hypothetical protein